jgi:sialate O-acetylesterase
MRRLCTAGVGVLAGSLALSAAADVRLPAIISDHMVLEQDADVPIWGWAGPDEPVTVMTDWMQIVSAKPDASGRWRVSIHTPHAGGIHRLTVAGKNRVEVSDILIGEVWVCSGQSNMEWPLSAAQGGKEEAAGANDAELRFFNVENAVAAGPRDDCKGAWMACTPGAAGNFSAVGYFFAKRLRAELKAPIGMVQSDWGGTPAEAWTSAAGLSAFPHFAPGLEAMKAMREHPDTALADQKKATEAWRTAVGEKDAGIREHWAAPDLDDSAWGPLTVPGMWAGDLASFDGVLWVRRTFDVPAGWAGKDLVFESGPIDDTDDTFINGVQVGSSWASGDFAKPRSYTVPASAVHAGKNTIVIRILDTGGPGGIGGSAEQLHLGPAGERSPLSLAGTWKCRKGPGVSDLPARPRSTELGPNWPSSLYNGMIAPIAGYGIRGAIWYQGEANVGQAYQYRTLFPGMIADWRKQWGRGDFPFYFVQIAPFRYDRDEGQAAELREAQTMALSTPNTGMAVTMDIGNPADIHPKNKRDVGSRLARWALAKCYGQSGLAFSGPMYRQMTVKGNAIRLEFDHAEGLTARGGTLAHFTIAGDDHHFVDAQAKVEGQAVVVSSDQVAKPVAVRYCWGAGDEGTLMNGDGLPAPSFRTDTTKGLTQP